MSRISGGKGLLHKKNLIIHAVAALCMITTVSAISSSAYAITTRPIPYVTDNGEYSDTCSEVTLEGIAGATRDTTIPTTTCLTSERIYYNSGGSGSTSSSPIVYINSCVTCPESAPNKLDTSAVSEMARDCKVVYYTCGASSTTTCPGTPCEGLSSWGTPKKQIAVDGLLTRCNSATNTCEYTCEKGYYNPTDSTNSTICYECPTNRTTDSCSTRGTTYNGICCAQGYYKTKSMSNSAGTKIYTMGCSECPSLFGVPGATPANMCTVIFEDEGNTITECYIPADTPMDDTTTGTFIFPTKCNYTDKGGVVIG